jgi:hypothetical protein
LGAIPEAALRNSGFLRFTLILITTERQFIMNFSTNLDGLSSILPSARSLPCASRSRHAFVTVDFNLKETVVIRRMLEFLLQRGKGAKSGFSPLLLCIFASLQ